MGDPSIRISPTRSKAALVERNVRRVRVFQISEITCPVTATETVAQSGTSGAQASVDRVYSHDDLLEAKMGEGSSVRSRAASSLSRGIEAKT